MSKRVTITEWQVGVAQPGEWPLGRGDYRGRNTSYRFVRFESPRVALFQSGEGDLERFAARAGGVAGYHLHWRGTDWEPI